MIVYIFKNSYLLIWSAFLLASYMFLLLLNSREGKGGWWEEINDELVFIYA